MDTLDVAASYATVAGSVHRRERILTIYTPHVVAKPLSRKSAMGYTITMGEAPKCFRSQKYALRSWASKAYPTHAKILSLGSASLCASMTAI